MSYKPRTSLDLNLFHINRTLRKLENRDTPIADCGLNKRFDKLKEQSKVWHDDLYPKYIQLAKKLNQI